MQALPSLKRWRGSGGCCRVSAELRLEPSLLWPWKGGRDETGAERCLAWRKHTACQKHRDTGNNRVKETSFLITMYETTAQLEPANFDFSGKLHGAHRVTTRGR